VTPTLFSRQFAILLWLASLAAPAAAQPRAAISLPESSPFLGGVPSGTATAAPVTLSLVDAIKRGLEHNLGVLEAELSIDRARGARRLALSQLLPNIRGNVVEARQVLSLEAFGFPLNGLPPTVGPFNTFDARLFARQSIFDLRALGEVRAESHNVVAARLANRSARNLVALVVANLYLETLAAAARSESARAQLETAQALHTQSLDLKQSGIIAGIDVVRADVRLRTERQRTTAAANQFERSKLQLARVIGLPIGQRFELVAALPDIPTPELTLEQAVERAYRDRPDFLAAIERGAAAEAHRTAVAREVLPSLHVTADYGALGLTPGSTRSTFSVRGALEVPIFEGGRTQARLLEADAELRSRRAEIEDLRAEIYYDVRTAQLDMQALGEELQVATGTRELAAQQLTQARDRFAAGVASSVEVVQAQEAVALASEQYISALYGFTLAKGMFAQSIGPGEDALANFLGGVAP
jgi:outer membrane protein TolC